MSQATLPRRAQTHRVPLIVILLGIGAILLLVGGAANAVWQNVGAPYETISHAQPLLNARDANVRLSFGAGNLRVRALDASDNSLSRMSFEGPAALRPEASYTTRNGAADLAYVSPDGQQVWQNFPFIGRARDHSDLGVQLTPNIPLTLEVDAGAADATLDLTNLRVSRLNVRTGASDTQIRLPANAGLTSVSIDAALGQLDVRVPAATAARLDVTTALGTNGIDQARFRRIGNGRYESADYATAANRVDMRIELGAGDLSVR
jgi:hypothetical protein